MQSDEVVWQIINHQFCSFKSKVAKEHTFCQNPYSVTGLCIRSACPLANSRYATIREEDGVCYLFIKTAERAHTPKKLWEKIKLPSDYMKALELVSNRLEHFPKYLVHRNKQRLTKIHQMLIRMRKLKLKTRPKIVTTNTKVDRREVGRERKALKAAQLDRAIEAELLERLRQVTEGEIYNYPEVQYTKALTKAANQYSKEVKRNKSTEGSEKEDEEGEEELEEEYEGEEDIEEELESTTADGRSAGRSIVEGGDEEEEEDEDAEAIVEYIEDFDESEDEEEDIEEVAALAAVSAGKGVASPPSATLFINTFPCSGSIAAVAGKKRAPAADLSLAAAKKSKKTKATGSKESVRTRAHVAIEYELEDDEELGQVTAVNSRINSSAIDQDVDYNF